MSGNCSSDQFIENDFDDQSDQYNNFSATFNNNFNNATTGSGATSHQKQPNCEISASICKDLREPVDIQVRISKRDSRKAQ